MCIVLDTGQISPHELGTAYSKLLNKTEFLNKNNGFTKELSTKEIDEKINESNVYNDDYLGNLLRFTGIMYFSQFDIMVNALAERNNIHYDNASRIIVVGFKPNLYDANPGQNLISKEGYFYIDVLSNISKNISKTNDEKSLEAFRFTRGLFSSELESSVLNQILGVECFSTTTILRYANERNIPLAKLSADSKTKVDDLSINESDKVEIQNAIDAGNTVIVPTSNMKIGSWNGVGYIITSFDNSVQYYKISGQYNGGSTSIPVALASIVNIAIDALWLAEGVTAMIAILTGMTALSFFPVVGLMIAAISIELLVIDIMSTVLDNYDYYINGDDEAGENIRLSATINVLTFGVFKGASAVSKGIKYAGVAQKYGKATISNLKSAGFTTSQITSKVNQFKNLGISTTTIETLLKNPKCMFLGDDILTFLGKQGGNQGLLAELVISNGDDFTKALMKTGALDDFCNLAWKYGNESTKLLLAGDDVIKKISSLDDLTSSRLKELSYNNGNLNDWASLIVENDKLSYKSANIFNSNGKNLTELDEVDFLKKIIYEDKNASGLYIDNPSVVQTEQQWAEKQILGKGGNRIKSLLQDDLKVTITTNSGEVTDVSFTLSELKNIDDYVFRINADTPALRTAVEDCLEQLRILYPEYKFSAVYGA